VTTALGSDGAVAGDCGGGADLGSAAVRVNMPFGSNPGCTAKRRWKLRISSPAPTRRVSARATSAITNASLKRRRAKPSPDRAPDSWSASYRSRRPTWYAGMRPTEMPTRIDTPAAKAATVQSVDELTKVGSVIGLALLRSCTDHAARSRPKAEPIKLSS